MTELWLTCDCTERACRKTLCVKHKPSWRKVQIEWGEGIMENHTLGLRQLRKLISHLQEIERKWKS